MSELKTAYGGQTPKTEDGDIEVYALIENANRLIDSVYRDIGMSSSTCSPESPGINSNSRRQQQQQSSTPTRTRLQLEIEKIHRFCDSIDEEVLLPSIPHRRYSAAQSSSTYQPSNQNMNMSLGDEIETANLDAAFIEGPNRSHQAATGRRTCSLNMPTTAPPLPIAPIADDDDDDVIIVSSTLSDVVDLCTPVHETQARRRRIRRNENAPPYDNLNSSFSSIFTRPPLNSRSRSPLDGSSSSHVSTGPQSVQTFPTHHQRLQLQRQLFLSNATPNTGAGDAASVSSISLNSSAASSSSADGAGNERPILMCPVCMESSVKRKPTSTKCGHVFCQSCINQALRLTHKCPLCNTKLNNRMLFRIYL